MRRDVIISSGLWPERNRSWGIVTVNPYPQLGPDLCDEILDLEPKLEAMVCLYLGILGRGLA